MENRSVESAGFSDATMIPQQQNDLNYLINLSRLTIRGKYDVSGNYHYLFPVYGYGSFEILLHDVIGIMNTTVYSTYGSKSNHLSFYFFSHLMPSKNIKKYR